MTGGQGDQWGHDWNRPDDPYSAQPQPQPQPTQSYPAQSYPHSAYAALPAEQGGYGGPPRRPSRLPAVLGILAIVVIVSAVVTVILLDRGGSDPVATPTSSASPTPSRPTTESSTTSTRTTRTRTSPPTTSSRPVEGRVVDNAEARLRYPVPEDWAVDPAGKTEVLGVTFTGAAVYGAYECQDASYSRTFAVSAAVQSTKDKPLDATQTAATFGKAFAEKFYPGAQLTDPITRESEIDGKKAILLVVGVVTRPTKPECEATRGEVSVLAVDLDNATAERPSGVALLVVTSDLGGGPATPKALPVTTVQGVLAGTQVR